MIYIKEEFPTKADAEAFKERYEQSYPPMGYGTHIKVTERTFYRGTPGIGTTVWWVTGSRGASCD